MRVEAAARLEHAQEGLLRQVEGGLDRADQGQGRPERSRLVSVDQEAEGLRLAGAGAADQLGLVLVRAHGGSDLSTRGRTVYSGGPSELE